MNDTNLLEDQPVAWTPTPEVIERAQLTKFMRQVGVSTWDELYEYSIRDVEQFTAEVLKFLDIKFDPPYEKLLDISDGVEFPQWFGRRADTTVRMSVASTRKSADDPRSSIDTDSSTGGAGDADKSVRSSSAGLNITSMCLDRWQTAEMKNEPAIIWEGEEGGSVTLTYVQLLTNVDACVEKLRDLQLGEGDAIGIHLPMIPETVVALLAINRIGAIAVPVFSGYGIDAISSRMEAVGAKALFTCDGFPRRGKPFDMLTVAARAVANVPSIHSIILVERNTYTAKAETTKVDHIEMRERRRVQARNYEYLRNDVFAGRRVALFRAEPDLSADDDTVSLPAETSAEDPLIILYTSGTTGRPKGIAHTHASFPIKAAQDMALGTDVGRGTRISWYTDIGWMMGPWLIYGALVNGATICIYDGAPDHPTPDRMWEFVAKHKVEVLGISPTLIRSLAAHERSADTPVRMSAKHEAVNVKSDVDSSTAATTDRKGWSRKGRLPHFDGEVTQFITFRLADALPRPVLERLRLEMDQNELAEDSEEYRQKVEDYLDTGAGDCILKDPAVANIVKTTILSEDGVSCDLKAWVIMPNHVHLLLRLREGYDLTGIMKRIKGISARRINQRLGSAGSVWQAEYFDRYIRDADHYSKVHRYIRNNPLVAGLTTTPEEWAFGSSFAASGDADKSVRAPFQRHDLSSLRAFASTGEPWNPAPWWWLFQKVGNSKLPIINYSGGTEISGGILMGNPLLPQKPCSFPAPCPGMDVDILDEEGNSVGQNQVGELVIKQPWIGMARGFWQERERYLETYWNRFENIWVHGDWAMRDSDGHYFILGRSDDTLKVAGKRVGPAEVEGLLVAHPLVAEAAVIGVPDEKKGTAMVAFCVLSSSHGSDTLPYKGGVDAASADRPGTPPYKGGADAASADRPGSPPYKGGVDAASADGVVLGRGTEAAEPDPIEMLQAELRSLVARDMGKPLAPSKVHFVSALPKTRNAKVMRRVIRAAYLGEDPGDLSALENPQTVSEIRDLGQR